MAMLILAVMAVMMIWMGQGALRQVGKVLEAEQFVLRDSDGRMRGELTDQFTK